MGGRNRGAGNIRAHWGAAVASASESVRIIPHLTNAGGASLLTASPTEIFAEYVPSRTLDSLVEGVGNVCLIKIDIEGSELRAFRGASRLLERSGGVSAILFELSADSLRKFGDS